MSRTIFWDASAFVALGNSRDALHQAAIDVSQQLAEENRLLLNNYPGDWEAYNIFEPVYQPRNISPEDLYQGLIDAYRTVSSPLPSLKRGIKTFIKTKSLFSTGISFFWNYDSYKTISTITSPQIHS